MAATGQGRSFDHEPFWGSVVQFLVRQEMLDPDLVGPIVEWQDEESPELRWTIEEITDGRALVAEGKAMNHCVASYLDNCRRGKVSIWSMQVQPGSSRRQHVMTVAIQRNSRHINQARGRRNAAPKSSDANVHKL